MSMTQELPRLRQDVGENLIAQMDALLPPTDPTKPFVDRGDGLKFVRFRGRFAQYEDDGTWEIPDSFWTESPLENGVPIASDEDGIK